MTTAPARRYEAHIQRVLDVLSRRGHTAAERAHFEATLRAAPDPPKLELALDGYTPSRRALVAPTDARLVVEGDRVRFVLSSGTEFGEQMIDPSRLNVPSETDVYAGEILTDGDVYAPDWLAILGAEGLPKIRAQLATLLAPPAGPVDEHTLDALLAPMLDGVQLVAIGGELPEPSVMTRERFERDTGWTIANNITREGLGQEPTFSALLTLDERERAKRWWDEQLYERVDYQRFALPFADNVLLNYRQLARMDEWGLVLSGPFVDLPAFIVESATISLSDAAVLARRPDRALESAAQHSFGARRGRWNTRAILSSDRRRVDEVRAWHESASALLRDEGRDKQLVLSSGRVLVCDLSKPAWSNGARIAARCEALLASSGPLFTAIDVEGFEGHAFAAPRGARRCFVRAQTGADDRTEALSLRFSS